MKELAVANLKQPATGPGIKLGQRDYECCYKLINRDYEEEIALLSAKNLTFCSSASSG